VSAKYQSKGPIYILNLSAFAEMSLFLKCIFGKEKAGYGIALGKCGIRDSREKGAGMRDQDPPFQTLYKGDRLHKSQPGIYWNRHKSDSQKLI